ncbi:Hypothetical predicted protein [Mytilus galloprovincialis]|uniref:Uncharacterized protein n=1 Tax=Mytilus galloprovincialis TaxID=29158 RepID=A0A8B6E2Q3_MYTGA|nr:Hypothetical predicted protein [Mytilus galloprovincialis]
MATVKQDSSPKRPPNFRIEIPAPKLPCEADTITAILNSPEKSLHSVNGELPTNNILVLTKKKEISLKDSTGKATVAVWDSMVDTIQKGKVINISKCRVRLFNAEKKLSTTNASVLEGCENRILFAQNVRSTVTCTECDKPRCVYSKLKLTPRDVRALKHTIDKYYYTCGAILPPEGDVLHGKAFERLQMSCTTHIEFAYYGSSVGRLYLCVQCPSPDTTTDPELLKKFKIVLPVCKACIDRKKQIQRNILLSINHLALLIQVIVCTIVLF